MSAYTPGPWVWNGSTDIYENDTGFTICEFYKRPADGSAAMANARLIAAAPELLEALLQCDPGEEYEIDDGVHDSGAFCELAVKDMRAIRKAIAKATGKDSA